MVDDDITCLNAARNILAENYDVFTVPSGKKLFQILEKVTPDLILLDIEMPEMNGYDVIKILKNAENTADIPVIFLTSIIDPESELKGLSLGAADYITKPFSQQLLLKRIEVHLFVASQKNGINDYRVDLEKIAEEKRRAVFEMQNAILKTVAELVECRNNIMAGHIERTQNYLKLFMEILTANNYYAPELSTWDIDLFLMASELHDIGKISISDSILMKPDKLTKEEFDEIKKHTVFGVNIIRKIEQRTSKNLFLKYARILAGSHHEKWDGTGYPLGLKGEEIPLQGRLMAIVDVYDALTHDHPYKRTYTHEEAIDIIRDGANIHFDPLLDEVFVKHEKDFKDIIILHNSFRGKYLGGYLSSGDLQFSISKTVSNIVDARVVPQDEYPGNAVIPESAEETEKIQRFLKIFTEALLVEDGRYRDEILTWDINIFFMSAQLHDVGKMAVNDRILNKTGKLTEEEFEKIKSHADFGVKVVNKIKENLDEGEMLAHAEAFVGSHHEKWDGTGYPLGLKGEEIPLQGRIMAIIDVYEALTSNRPQRKKMPHEDAVNIIKSCGGTSFDPGLVSIFLKHEKDFSEVAKQI